MSPFFELRIYQVFPGKMDQWIALMDNEVIPFQTQKGMCIQGTFVLNSSDQFSLQDGKRTMNSAVNGNTYVWIRKFDSKKDKEKLYNAVYESKEWLNTFRPKVMRLIDINSILVHNLSATELSKIK